MRDGAFGLVASTLAPWSKEPKSQLWIADGGGFGFGLIPESLLGADLTKPISSAPSLQRSRSRHTRRCPA
ncbi:MAG: hypothetical protein LBU32_22160 [Clostridiales bacterium]|nr:hypothetical protein [Clostridiales bacterium]